MSKLVENTTELARATMPRWWQSKRGMIGVIVVLGYFLLPAIGKSLPEGSGELVRLIILALFVSVANGEKKA